MKGNEPEIQPTRAVTPMCSMGHHCILDQVSHVRARTLKLVTSVFKPMCRSVILVDSCLNMTGYGLLRRLSGRTQKEMSLVAVAMSAKPMIKLLGVRPSLALSHNGSRMEHWLW